MEYYHLLLGLLCLVLLMRIVNKKQLQKTESVVNSIKGDIAKGDKEDLPAWKKLEKLATEITSENYQEFAPLEVVAFSLAHAGASGEGGGVYIIAANNSLYHTNIIYSIKLEEAFVLCPPLKDCYFNPAGSSVQEGWHSSYMGLGNFLVVSDLIFDNFQQQIKGLEPFEIYPQWKEIVLKCLKYHNRAINNKK